MFFFLAYEGQRRRETIQVTQTVPNNELGNGIMQYVCDPSADANCVVGSPNSNGFTVLSDRRAGLNASGQPNLVAQLTADQFAALDPNARMAPAHGPTTRDNVAPIPTY
jgi:hypothetical protein